MTVCITNFYVGAVASIRENVAFDDMVFFKSLLDFWGQQMSGGGNPMSRLFYNGRSASRNSGQQTHPGLQSSPSIQLSTPTPKIKSKKKNVPTHIKVSSLRLGHYHDLTHLTSFWWYRFTLVQVLGIIKFGRKITLLEILKVGTCTSSCVSSASSTSCSNCCLGPVLVSRQGSFKFTPR